MLYTNVFLAYPNLMNRALSVIVDVVPSCDSKKKDSKGQRHFSTDT